MSTELMNTKEVAEYLGVHEKQIYALIKGGKIPCTRVTGKWIFPRHLIDQWIFNNARENDETDPSKSRAVRGALLAAGSNDPILDILLNRIKQRYPDLLIFSCSTGSTEGLNKLREGMVDIAWCHLFNPQSGRYDISAIEDLLPNKKSAIVHLFYRDLGFIYSKNITGEISSFNDLIKKDVTFINRQRGSGTRILIDHLATQEGVNPEAINGYDNSVYSHMEVGLAILSGEAQAGIATVAVASLLGLNFVPLVKESFDMVMLQETFFQREVQACIEILKDEQFLEKVQQLCAYDFNDSGKIIYSSGG